MERATSSRATDRRTPAAVSRAGSGSPQPASMVRFTSAARLLGQAARASGLVSPGFRSPPRLVGADRTLRRRREGCTVAVRVRGRLWVAVLADMVEGVVAANRLTGPPADRAREVLWDALAVELAGVGSAAAVA